MAFRDSSIPKPGALCLTDTVVKITATRAERPGGKTKATMENLKQLDERPLTEEAATAITMAERAISP